MSAVRDEPGKPDKKPKRKGIPPRVRLLLVILVFTLLVLLVVAVVKDIASTGEMAEGVKIDREAVGGMSKARALETAKQAVARYKGPVTVSFEGNDYEVEMKSIDFRTNPEAMVQMAYLEGRGWFAPARLFKRLFGMSSDVDVPVVFTYDEAALKKRVEEIAKAVDRDPLSVSISIASGSPDIVPSKDGVKTKVGASQEEVAGRLSSEDRRVDLAVDYIKPELTEKDVGKIVIIDKSEFTLYLYDREEYVADYQVAVGMPAYPTPTGKFHIYFKEKNPTWLPTSEWAKDKQGIPQPPGPDNPLGGYWMDLGSGLGIHETPFEKSLGEQASHGCIRMSEEGAADLYSQVKVGTPVFIVE